MSSQIDEAIEKLGSGPLTPEGLQMHIWHLFSRVLARNQDIYLANHSLGRPLDQTAQDIKEGLDLWYDQLDSAWEYGGWPAELSRFQANVAKLIGHSDATAIIPKSSAGQGLRAVLNAFPVDRSIRVVTTAGEFDSVDFILKSYVGARRAGVRWVGPSEESPVPLFDCREILIAIKEGADLVVVSMVYFTTGQVLGGLDQIIEAAHKTGAKVLIDAYHAVGVLPVDFQQLDADFMIGGSYKYTRGGPGACWLAIHPRNLEMQTLDTGWFAKRDPFEYVRSDSGDRAAGGTGWMESTPPVIIPYQARAGLEFTLAMGVERLREYNFRQQATLRQALRQSGVNCHEPDDPTGFGAFTLVPNPHANEAAKRLRSAGVNTDARGGFIRFGPDILNSDEELLRAAKISGQVLG
ncbi:MAG TPA: aminotransferase class V-fold PLP-dependent enzyme [Fimbriimonadaceae bacterium]|nr:aminotransferase class V-fold PLP-dependent enzyme [Fimbriimonadaceae bacterium]